MTSLAPEPPSPPPRRPWLAIGLTLALAIVALNLGAYIWMRSEARPKPDPEARPETPERPDAEQLAQAQREAAIEAIRDDQYERAIALLESARLLRPDLGEVDGLLEVARKMKARASIERSPEESAPEAEETPDAEVEKAPAPPRPRPRRRRRPRARKPAPREVAELLVTSDPSGLVVEVDGDPAALSPAKLELPPGEHTVRVRRGARVIEERTVELSPEQPTVVEAVLDGAREQPAAEETGAEARTVSTDPELDLVELVDRGRGLEAEAAPLAARRAAPRRGRSASPSRGSTLVVVWPRPARPALARALRAELSGVPVEVVPSLSPDRLRDDPEGVGAVLAAPEVLRGLGLEPALRASASPPAPHVLASFEGPPDPSGATSGALGILDRLGPRRTRLFVARLLGAAPRSIRRVAAPEDLLSMLQLGVVDVVLVPRADLAAMRARTRRTLHVTDVEGAVPPLAVGFVGGAPLPDIASGLRSVGAETMRALGLEGWE
jgi:hypothetical protein